MNVVTLSQSNGKQIFVGKSWNFLLLKLVLIEIKFFFEVSWESREQAHYEYEKMKD